MNPECELECYAQRLDEKNAKSFVKPYDLVIDGSDNFATRFSLADVCKNEKKPLVTAAISGFEAQLSTFKPYLGHPHPCYRCFVPQTPEREISCEQEGIIGPLAGMMGSMQALEAIRELLSIGSLSGQLLLFDALSMQPRIVSLPRDPACRFCA
jgi:adenylyltransferase/sulfurtransferase